MQKLRDDLKEKGRKERLSRPKGNLNELAYLIWAWGEQINTQVQKKQKAGTAM